MKTPATSRHFSEWRNPQNGLPSFVLTTRVAPVQRPFYFTSPSYVDGGRFLWFECAFPPEGGRDAVPVLGVVDFAEDAVRVYHETQHPTARPAVDLVSGRVYWANGSDIWGRGPEAQDRPFLVNRFPRELLQGRAVKRLATHLTLSADGRSLCMDAWIGEEVFIGVYPLDGSAPEIWQRTRTTFDHAQSHPLDPDLLLLAHEYWVDPTSGPFDPQHRYHRIYTARKGEAAQPLLVEPVTHSGHEWWDASGERVWYVHYGVGIKSVNLRDRSETLVWSGHLAHGQSDAAGLHLIADSMADPVTCECRVQFRNGLTGRVATLVDHPALRPELTQCRHLHPHPMFCLGDRYVCHSTLVHDRVDVALCRTEDLLTTTA